MSCSLANSTSRVIQARSTHSVVGLWGNDSTTTRGLGHADSHASIRLSKKAAPPRRCRPSLAGRRVEAHVADVGPGEERGVDVDRVGRRRHQGGVARTDQHPHQVGEPLLGPDGGHHLGLGVELHVELAQVEVGDGLADLRDAPAGRVAVVARVVGRLGQLLHGHVGRGQVGVAEAHVDDVPAVAPGRGLQVVDGGEDVRRQPVDPAEFHAPGYRRHPDGPTDRRRPPRSPTAPRSAASATTSSESGQAHTAQVAPAAGHGGRGSPPPPRPVSADRPAPGHLDPPGDQVGHRGRRRLPQVDRRPGGPGHGHHRRGGRRPTQTGTPAPATGRGHRRQPLPGARRPARRGCRRPRSPPGSAGRPVPMPATSRPPLRACDAAEHLAPGRRRAPGRSGPPGCRGRSVDVEAASAPSSGPDDRAGRPGWPMGQRWSKQKTPSSPSASARRAASRAPCRPRRGTAGG